MWDKMEIVKTKWLSKEEEAEAEQCRREKHGVTTTYGLKNKFREWCEKNKEEGK